MHFYCHLTLVPRHFSNIQMLIILLYRVDMILEITTENIRFTYPFQNTNVDKWMHGKWNLEQNLEIKTGYLEILLKICAIECDVNMVCQIYKNGAVHNMKKLHLFTSKQIFSRNETNQLKLNKTTSISKTNIIDLINILAKFSCNKTLLCENCIYGVIENLKSLYKVIINSRTNIEKINFINMNCIKTSNLKTSKV